MKKILFVCTGNSFRSAVAEALLKKVRGDIHVESAGIQPASKIASNAKRLLDEEGALENLKRKPEGIEQKNLEEYDLIVVMKEHHKNEILQRHFQVKDRMMGSPSTVWINRHHSVLTTVRLLQGKKKRQKKEG